MKTCLKLRKINKLFVSAKLTVSFSEALPSRNEMVDGNDGKLNGRKFLISDFNHCHNSDSNGDQEYVFNSAVFDGDYDKSVGKLK